VFLIKHWCFFLLFFYNWHLQGIQKLTFFAPQMKRIISILLILVTALYVLPVSDGFIADIETNCKCVDKTAYDGMDGKKDNGKEFMSTGLILNPSKNSKVPVAMLSFPCALHVHFTIETPPPDKA